MQVPRRLLYIVGAIALLFSWGLRQLRVVGILSFWGYASALVTGTVIIVLCSIWAGLKLAPTGFATTSEDSFSVSESFEKVCEEIPIVVSKNHWKLEEDDLKKGHFKVKIGMSLHTFSSTMLIDVNTSDGDAANVHVLCGTRSSNDPGHNDKMINKFRRGLENAL